MAKEYDPVREREPSMLERLESAEKRQNAMSEELGELQDTVRRLVTVIGCDRTPDFTRS